jgi:hypothetical protein
MAHRAGLEGGQADKMKQELGPNRWLCNRKGISLEVGHFAD